jgi:hypothetical protein
MVKSVTFSRVFPVNPADTSAMLAIAAGVTAKANTRLMLLRVNVLLFIVVLLSPHETPDGKSLWSLRTSIR